MTNSRRNNNPRIKPRDFLLGLFLPPVAVFLTLKKQNNPSWSIWWLNILLTFFGIPGSIHALLFIAIQQPTTSQPSQPQLNNESIDVLGYKINRNQLQLIQLIVSIIPILSFILGIFTFFITFQYYEFQKQNSSSTTQTTDYVCNDKTGRYKLYYTNMNEGYPKLRITRDTDDNKNIRKKLEAEDQLIFLDLSSDRKWQYVCVEKTNLYGWVYSKYVKK